MSDRGGLLLGGLLSRLRPWFEFIQRATHAQSVDVVPKQFGEFNVVVSEVAKSGPWSVPVELTRMKCFGVTYPLGPDAWALTMRPCDFARDIVKSVLTSRGFL